MDLTLDQLHDQFKSYFHAWQSNDPSDVASLFTEDDIYYYGPFREPARGRDTIVANWTAYPAQQTDIRYDFEVLATGGNLGVARWNVSFRTVSRPEKHIQLGGILALKFTPSLECIEHPEWYSESGSPLKV